MKYILSTFLILTVFFSSMAQSDCNCKKNFEEISQKITDNYVAFESKTAGLEKAKYKAVLKKTKDAAQAAKSQKECFDALSELTGFFKDNHLFINNGASFSVTEDPALALARSKVLLSQPYTSEDKFQKYLSTNSGKLNDAEGIWISDDQAYTVGIIKVSETKLWGFLLSDKDNLWKAGKHKFSLDVLEKNKFKAEYFFADFTSEINFARMVDDYLIIDNIYKFQKKYPNTSPKMSPYNTAHILPDYRVEKIDEDNTLIVLPPFLMNNAPLFTNEMLVQNESLILNSKNLIIDLRNNPGGDEGVFDNIFPYFANKPIIRKGSKIRASQENLILISHELKSISEIPQYKGLEPKLRTITNRMEQNMGSMITGPDKTFDEYKEQSKVKKVIILVNKKTASTAESISLEAKQNAKVVIMGTQTKGAFDYTEVRDWALPCYSWRLALPLGLSHRLPLNPLENVGIKPDVLVPDTEIDWVSFALKYLNANK